MYNWEIIGDKIFGILKGFGFHLEMTDKDGNDTLDTHDATRFYGTIKSNDPELKQFSVLISVHDENARSHIDLSTLKTLKSDEDFNIVKKLKDSLDSSIGDREGIKINWYKFDRIIKPRPDAINESKDISKAMGTSKSSYQRVGSGRIILRHNNSIDETKQGSRWRNIKAIFVENSLGERFLYPYIHPSGARAMARHLSNNGTMHDNIGTAIKDLSGDYIALKNAYRLLNSSDQQTIAETIKESMRSVNKKVRRLSGPRGYSTLSKELDKPILIDEAAVKLLHKDMMEKCDCSDFDSDHARQLLVAARYLKEANIQIDDGIKFIGKPDLTSRASEFSDQRSRLAWQIAQLASCIAAGSTKDKLIAIATDIEDGRVVEPDELDLIRKVFMACKHDSTIPFEPSEPELDRIKSLSGL